MLSDLVVLAIETGLTVTHLTQVVKSKHMPEPVLEATESTNAAIQVGGISDPWIRMV